MRLSIFGRIEGSSEFLSSRTGHWHHAAGTAPANQEEFGGGGAVRYEPICQSPGCQAKVFSVPGSARRPKRWQQRFVLPVLQTTTNVNSFASGTDADIMIPLTTSLYIPGKIENVESVLVDIGTGFVLYCFFWSSWSFAPVCVRRSSQYFEIYCTDISWKKT